MITSLAFHFPAGLLKTLNVYNLCSFLKFNSFNTAKHRLFVFSNIESNTSLTQISKIKEDDNRNIKIPERV